MAAPPISAIPDQPPVAAPSAAGAAALDAFHRGDPAAIERCYRDHFDAVENALRPVLGAADRETVIHEVFWRLLSNPDLRRSFQGGSMSAWLATVTRNLGIDYARRLSREVALPPGDPHHPVPALDGEVDARLLLEQFQQRRLRSEWRPVFEARFLRQLSQREAAAALRINRTTLAYRELRIRQALRAFLMEDEP
jgi:RNA polymerase sigma-70 factor (ECF subfamily)